MFDVMKTVTTREFLHGPGLVKTMKAGQNLLVTDKGEPSFLVTKVGARPRKTRADLEREALEIWEIAYAAQRRHPVRLEAAATLIMCLVSRAQAGENWGYREMQARQLCDRYGFDFDERQATASQYPRTPR